MFWSAFWCILRHTEKQTQLLEKSLIRQLIRQLITGGTHHYHNLLPSYWNWKQSLSASCPGDNIEHMKKACSYASTHHLAANSLTGQTQPTPLWTIFSITHVVHIMTESDLHWGWWVWVTSLTNKNRTGQWSVSKWMQVCQVLFGGEGEGGGTPCPYAGYGPDGWVRTLIFY